jgi:hypothetical protein
VKDGKVFLKSFRDFPDRVIGEVKDTEENAIKYFISRFSVISGKVENLVHNIETAQNKGSFLMSLLHLKNAVPLYDALGDFEALLKKLEQAEVSLSSLIHQNRSKNKEIKEALIEEAKQAVINPDWKEATRLLVEVNGKWIKTGKADKDLDEQLDTDFREIYSEFYARKKAFYEEIQTLYVKRLEQYTELMVKAREMYRRKAPLSELKPLQAAWREVGTVPKVMLQDVMKDFRRSVKDLVRIHRTFKPREQSYSKWENICAEVEKMIADKDFTAQDKIKGIQERWKLAGKLPPNRLDILHRFTAAIDKYFEVSYLENTLKRKYPRSNEMAEKDQLEAKILLMKEFIRREKMEIETFQNNLQSVSTKDQNSEMEITIKKKLVFQNKRLENKMKLMEEIQKTLLAL